MKREDFILIAVGVLGVLVVINLIANFQNKGIESVTGSVVDEEQKEVSKEMIDQILELREEKKVLISEKEELAERIVELEGQLKVYEEEEEIKKEVCPLTCNKDELCVPINKASGDVEWVCVDDPDSVLGSG
jgi:seryl-tRNA synthetase